MAFAFMHICHYGFDVQATHLTFKVLHICENDILRRNETVVQWINEWMRLSNLAQNRIAFVQPLSDERKIKWKLKVSS